MKNTFAFLLLFFASVAVSAQIRLSVSDVTSIGSTVYSVDSIPSTASAKFWTMDTSDHWHLCVPSHKVTHITPGGTLKILPWDSTHQILSNSDGGYYNYPPGVANELIGVTLVDGMYCVGAMISDTACFVVADTCDQPSIDVAAIGNGKASLAYNTTIPAGMNTTVTLKRYKGGPGAGYNGAKFQPLPYTWQVTLPTDPDSLAYLKITTKCDDGYVHKNPGRYYAIPFVPYPVLRVGPGETVHDALHRLFEEQNPK